MKRFALPLANGKLAMHFGHCETFALLDTIPAKQSILKKSIRQPPEHQPGVLPDWLCEQQVDVVIAGGMGSRAQQLLADKGIEVVIGAPCSEPEELVLKYLGGSLKTGDNVCDH